MKVVFYAMLALNIAVFIWFSGQGDRHHGPLVVNDPGTEKLELLDREPVEKGEKTDKPVRKVSTGRARTDGVSVKRQARHRTKQAASAGIAVSATSEKNRSGCMRIGPFFRRDASSGLRHQLGLLGLDGGRLQVDSQVMQHYWVLISPAGDRDSARKMVDAMRQAGIRDIQLLYKARRYTISLGLFKRRQIADKRLQHIERLGFKPRIAIQEKRQVRYWLIYRRPDKDWLVGKWQELLAAWPGIRRQIVDCPVSFPKS